MNWYDSTARYQVSEGMLVDECWRALVTSFEGLRLESYKDVAGVWTIGYGHTLGVKRGQRITKERAYELLQADVKRFESAVNRQVEVPLTQYQFNALVSFAFNVGAGALESSTLLKRLNAREYNEVAPQLMRWVYADGKRSRGLERRRKVEGAMFDGADWRVYA